MNSIFKKLITTYIKAKDTNKPHLMKYVFKKDASLEMIVNSENISFPSKVNGIENITNTLIKDFSLKFENVYTICLENTIKEKNDFLVCDWVVFMNDRSTNEIKIGFGSYIWEKEDNLIKSLEIKIEQMDLIESSYLDEIMDIVESLPYPWCLSEELKEKFKDLKIVEI